MISRRNTPPPSEAAARHSTAESALRPHPRHLSLPERLPKADAIPERVGWLKGVGG